MRSKGCMYKPDIRKMINFILDTYSVIYGLDMLKNYPLPYTEFKKLF